MGLIEPNRGAKREWPTAKDSSGNEKLSINGTKLRDFGPDLPERISVLVEPWRVIRWQLKLRGLTLRDIIDRMAWRAGEGPLTKGNSTRPAMAVLERKYDQQLQRFRKHEYMFPWSKGSLGFLSFESILIYRQLAKDEYGLRHNCLWNVNPRSNTMRQPVITDDSGNEPDDYRGYEHPLPPFRKPTERERRIVAFLKELDAESKQLAKVDGTVKPWTEMYTKDKAKDFNKRWKEGQVEVKSSVQTMHGYTTNIPIAEEDLQYYDELDRDDSDEDLLTSDPQLTYPFYLSLAGLGPGREREKREGGEATRQLWAEAIADEEAQAAHARLTRADSVHPGQHEVRAEEEADVEESDDEDEEMEDA